MMDKQISWTQKLGDAVLSDQAGVLKAVQQLRAKAAQAHGSLTDTAQQKVVTENQTIIIQPAEPEKVYVPYYDSSSIYGPWDYGYPASYWPPYSGYGYGVGMGFVAGAVIGAAFWNNNCNWGGGNLQVNNFNNFNNINSIRGGQNWQHNVNHRRGAAYGNQQLRDRYGRGTQAGANGRRDFRGFDNNGIGNRGGLGDRNGIGGRNGGRGDRGGLANNGGSGRPRESAAAMGWAIAVAWVATAGSEAAALVEIAAASPTPPSIVAADSTAWEAAAKQEALAAAAVPLSAAPGLPAFAVAVAAGSAAAAAAGSAAAAAAVAAAAAEDDRFLENPR